MESIQTKAIRIAKMAEEAGETDNAQALASYLTKQASAATIEHGAKYNDFAVVIYRFKHLLGIPFVGENGDRVVAIIRGGRLITLFLRRSNQLNNAKGLGVDIVIGG